MVVVLELEVPPPVEVGAVGLVVVEDESPDELVDVEDCSCKSIRPLVTLAGKEGMAGAGVAEASDALVGEVALDAAWAGAMVLWVEVVVVVTVPVGATGVAGDAVVAALVETAAGNLAMAAGALGVFTVVVGWAADAAMRFAGVTLPAVLAEAAGVAGSCSV